MTRAGAFASRAGENRSGARDGLSARGFPQFASFGRERRTQFDRVGPAHLLEPGCSWPQLIGRNVTSWWYSGRIAQPTDIAEGAVQLLSDKASNVTGIALPVGGGYSVP
jgi:NAD(P)-dependent dehydrogenase (short-subunit alcohol dehydrogenase family)